MVWMAYNPSRLDEIVDIIDDFKESTLPAPTNFCSLLIKEVIAELVTKPSLPLFKMREGVGCALRNALSYHSDSESWPHRTPRTERVQVAGTLCKELRWQNGRTFSLLLHFFGCPSSKQIHHDKLPNDGGRSFQADGTHMLSYTDRGKKLPFL